MMKDFLVFLGTSQDVTLAYASTYSVPLVVLSVLTSVFASLMALEMAGRIKHPGRLGRKLVWLVPGALAMGGGVWAMHFIGMLAFSLPCGISYDPYITVLSVIPGVIASAVALWVISYDYVTPRTLLLGGTLMGTGIGAMHYTGMAAMQLGAKIYYDPVMFVLSVVFAIALAVLSLYAKFVLRQKVGHQPQWVLSVLASVLMGCAISGMHYIAMEAAYFIPVVQSTFADVGISPTALALTVAGLSVLMILLALSAAASSRYLETIGILKTEIARSERAERELLKLSSAVAQSPATVMITDTEGNLVYVNPKFVETSGYSAEEVLGRNPRFLKSNEAGNIDYSVLWKTITAGQEWRGEFYNKRKDGTPYWETASISAIRSKQGEIINFIAIKEDISDRKKMMDELSVAHAKAQLDAAQERVLEQLLHMSLTGMSMKVYLRQVVDLLLNEVPWLTLLHRGGVFLTKARGKEQTLELIADHSLAEEIVERCREIDFGHCLCGRAAATGRMVHSKCVDHQHDVTYPEMAPHGHYVVPIVQGETTLGVLTLYLPDGYERKDGEELFLMRVAEVLSIGISRRYASTELTEAKENAEKANKAKSDFLAAMSHDLRTPLNAIMGFSDMMRQEAFGALGHKNYEIYAEDIYSSGALLVSLINDVLDLSKIEAGKYELAEENISVHALIDVCVRQLNPMSTASNVTLNAHVPDDMAFLRGDERALIQIVNNLMSNAIKFTPPGGLVDVSAHLTDEGEIVVEVKDTGIGMSAEGVNKALLPFEQVDVMQSRNHFGTGLGLHLCVNLMKLFNGTLEITSKEHKGTVVALRFPADRTVH